MDTASEAAVGVSERPNGPSWGGWRGAREQEHRRGVAGPTGPAPKRGRQDGRAGRGRIDTADLFRISENPLYFRNVDFSRGRG
jgi:hypothetical protein